MTLGVIAALRSFKIQKTPNLPICRSTRLRRVQSTAFTLPPNSSMAKLESALWASARAVEERRDLLHRLMRRSRGSDQAVTTRRFERQAIEVEADLERIHGALASLTAAASPA